MKLTRLFAAIAIAPLAVIPALSLLFGPWAAGHGGLRAWLGIVGPAVAVAYPLVILVGLPMHLALVRQRCTTWRHYAIVGALLGAVPVMGYVVVAIAFDAKFKMSALAGATARNLEWGAIGMVVFGACSAGVALAFRALATASPSASR